jgi:hypothetical protein
MVHFTTEAWERLWRAVNLRGDLHQWFNELSRRYENSSNDLMAEESSVPISPAI